MKVIRLGKTNYFFLFGHHKKRFGLGISISRWDFDITIGPFWCSIEWWKDKNGTQI